MWQRRKNGVEQLGLVLSKTPRNIYDTLVKIFGALAVYKLRLNQSFYLLLSVLELWWSPLEEELCGGAER